MNTILLVEDEKEYRDILSKKLETAGYTVITAQNGQYALNTLKNNQVDLIILDLFMPVMDGLTFYYHLKHTLNKVIPVIILTNLTETAYPSEVKDFIVKANTSLDQVIEKIRSVLSQ